MKRFDGIQSGGYVPVRCLALPAPKAVCELNVAFKQVARDVAAAQITCLSLHGEDCVNTIRLDNDEDNRSCMSEMTAL